MRRQFLEQGIEHVYAHGLRIVEKLHQRSQTFRCRTL